MPEIVLTHVTKRWDKFYAVDDLNLVIDDNAFVTLLGPSGCGKTTTLRVVSGLEKPQNGIMTIDGVEMINADDAYYAEPSKRGLNLVFQSYALWPHMTVYNNIAFGLKIQKMDKAEIDRRVMDSLRMMRIDMYKDRYPTELSGGQQQRVPHHAAAAVGVPHAPPEQGEERQCEDGDARVDRQTERIDEQYVDHRPDVDRVGDNQSVDEPEDRQRDDRCDAESLEGNGRVIWEI